MAPGLPFKVGTCYAFCTMRNILLSALFLAILVPGLSQAKSGSGPNLPNDPRTALETALPFYDFASPGLKPWHLKATYRFYDEKGKPSQQGTWEYWWASPKVHRSHWTRAGLESTEWSTAEGVVYKKGTGSPLRHFERTIENTVISPLPARAVVDSGGMALELKLLPPRNPKFACVFATVRSPSNRKPQTPSGDMTSEYCFEPPAMALRMTNASHITNLYNQIVKIEGHFLAREVEIKYANQPLFSVSVNTIEGFQPVASDFSPPSDAVFERVVTTPQEKAGSYLAVGTLVRRTQPIYPMISKMDREQGIVLLAAVIGTDGEVHDLEVLASPSPRLTQSAVEAVKTWQYTPYLLNGQPVEVETVVNVIFSLGR